MIARGRAVASAQLAPMTKQSSHPAGQARRAQSSLARAQADQVAAALATGGIEHRASSASRLAGDVDQRHLTEIGGSGVFVSAVRDALRRGEIDVAVHSLKDLPTARRRIWRSSRFRRARTPVMCSWVAGSMIWPTACGSGPARHDARCRSWIGRLAGISSWTSYRFGATSRPGSRRAREGVVDAVILAAAGLRRLERTG